MPSDLTVQPAAPGFAPVVAPPRPTATPNPAASAFPPPNPTLRLDAALGLVVIEFRDAAGNVTQSIPSERQLEAYRKSQELAAGKQPS